MGINYRSLFYNVYESTVETPEQGVEYLQNYGHLYLLTLNIFYSLQYLLVVLPIFSIKNCLFKVNNQNTRIMCEIWTPE